MPFLPTTALLATAADLSGTGILTLAGAGLLVAWILSLLLHPFTACSSCKGTPRSYGAIATRSFRLCPACGGSGRQLRIGARIWPQNRD
ncbi:hypothetical protein ACU61A_27925 [Pseudonocardia sichuanensis]|uniref:Uncharacterized protein n=1 Tax=Pseudonocardia kunmingensis TaxID=630975 RepID=A0A543CZ36_9PSEU|nr:hypothetical protein [Pseudonocardia kunmingensis]TQM02311.1 hypothetical protein FB558_8177 [Pseudonocardia kunmingensis]